MLQAKGFEAWTETSSVPPTTLEENRFPYGWRYVRKRLPTGKEVYEQIPLTAADLLQPQEEDQVPQRNAHFQPMVDLVASLKTYYAKDPTMGVFGDLIMDWGIPGLDGPAPDIAIIPNVTQKEADRGIFKVVQEGTRPCLVIEVMSPGHPGDDTDKVTIYERAGIAEYFLIKPHLERELPYYSLRGYRLVKGVYREIPAKKGRLLSQTLQLWLEVTDRGRQVRLTEVSTGQRLLTPIETEEARLAAEEARLAAVARAEAAEAHAEAEAKARAELEQRVRELESLLKSRT
jgi:Uma2 family endonuclease